MALSAAENGKENVAAVIAHRGPLPSEYVHNYSTSWLPWLLHLDNLFMVRRALESDELQLLVHRVLVAACCVDQTINVKTTTTLSRTAISANKSIHGSAFSESAVISELIDDVRVVQYDFLHQREHPCVCLLVEGIVCLSTDAPRAFK